MTAFGRVAEPVAICCTNHATGSRRTSTAAASDALRVGFTAKRGLARIESICWVAEACDDGARVGDGLHLTGVSAFFCVRLVSGRGCSRSRWARKDVVSSVSSCWLSRGDRGSCGCSFEARVLSTRLPLADCIVRLYLREVRDVLCIRAVKGRLCLVMTRRSPAGAGVYPGGFCARDVPSQLPAHMDCLQSLLLHNTPIASSTLRNPSLLALRNATLPRPHAIGRSLSAKPACLLF